MSPSRAGRAAPRRAGASRRPTARPGTSVSPSRRRAGRPGGEPPVGGPRPSTAGAWRASYRPAPMADPRRNVELKAVHREPDTTLAVALAAGAADHGLLVQRDTYFAAPNGRLKLRETEGG